MSVGRETFFDVRPSSVDGFMQSTSNIKYFSLSALCAVFGISLLLHPEEEFLRYLGRFPSLNRKLLLSCWTLVDVRGDESFKGGTADCSCPGCWRSHPEGANSNKFPAYFIGHFCNIEQIGSINWWVTALKPHWTVTKQASVLGTGFNQFPLC